MCSACSRRPAATYATSCAPTPHADHSPGAALLQALAVQAGKPRPAIGGLPSAPTARLASRFTPDHVLADGQRIAVQDAQGTVTHTLQAVFTPGHAANHVCFLLEEDALLFSGDHILNGSTTIIDPPDGNMREYIDSLDRLDALCAAHDARFILPAHGYVLGFARQAIAAEGPLAGARGQGAGRHAKTARRQRAGLGAPGL